MIRKLRALLSRRTPPPPPEPEPEPAPKPQVKPLKDFDDCELGRMWWNDELTSDEYINERMRRRREGS